MTNQELLRYLAFNGLEAKGLDKNQQYVDQLEYELKVIEELSFVTYFLVMWDIVQFAKNNNILYGPGRGSGCGSILNYCLEITHIDPIKYGLYFERFLNPSRVASPPDIDWDTTSREKIIDYLSEKYGEDKVARVGSINFLRTKSAIRDVGRVLEKEFSFVEKLTELVPPPIAGLWDSFEGETKIQPKLLDEKYEDIIGPVKKLWGTVRSYGTHAGGVAIAPCPINELVPLYKDKDGNPVSQFDWRDLEATGLLKFDILGLSTLEIIDLCLSYLKEEGIDIKTNDLEDEDVETYNLICSGDLDGVFQLGGSEGVKHLTMQIAPRNIKDLSLITALFRPGPLAAEVETKLGKKSMTDTAVLVRQGELEPEYLHPKIKPILEETHGVIVYQEQIMKICIELCGYTGAEADIIRKNLGKKRQDKMKEEQPKFVAGAVETSGIEKEKAEELFEQLQVYSQYLFNAAHSVAYSRITYITAYLKAHYPVHFYAALISIQNKPDNVIEFAGYAKERGITILPPDVNLSKFHHTPEKTQNGYCLRFGLGHIKGMPHTMAKEIIQRRSHGSI